MLFGISIKYNRIGRNQFGLPHVTNQKVIFIGGAESEEHG